MIQWHQVFMVLLWSRMKLPVVTAQSNSSHDRNVVFFWEFFYMNKFSLHNGVRNNSFFNWPLFGISASSTVYWPETSPIRNSHSSLPLSFSSHLEITCYLWISAGKKLSGELESKRVHFKLTSGSCCIQIYCPKLPKSAVISWEMCREQDTVLANIV